MFSISIEINQIHPERNFKHEFGYKNSIRGPVKSLHVIFPEIFNIVFWSGLTVEGVLVNFLKIIST